MSLPTLRCCVDPCGELPECLDDPTKHSWDGDEIVTNLAITLDVRFRMNGVDYAPSLHNDSIQPTVPGSANYNPVVLLTPYAHIGCGLCVVGDDHSWYLTIEDFNGGTPLYTAHIDSIQPVSAAWTADYVAATYTFENVETIKTS
jgi:hypothetical protein